jgi:DNA-directed RNA polymerase subunit M/transcription elongation factor TFIIS
MLEFKSCPRCQGDMITNRDIYGSYKECLQCGHMVDIEQPNKYLSLPGSRAKKTAA